MDTEIIIVKRPDGETERLQTVRLPDWECLEFFRPQPAEDPLPGLLRIYRQFIVPAFPWIFRQMVLVRMPERRQGPADGGLSDPEARLLAAAETLRKGLLLVRGEPRFRTEEARLLWKELEREGFLGTACGKLPFTQIIPVSENMGFLSESEDTARLKVNASFFIMDPFDCASPYDSVGTPFGLCVKNGEILSPPLYGREALLVRGSGRVSVEKPSLRDLVIGIGGKTFREGKNAEILTRPACRRTVRGKEAEAVVIGRKVIAVSSCGGLPVPAAGFVLRSPELAGISEGTEVRYHGQEDVIFGIQAGSSLLRDGVRSGGFLSPFYNVRGLRRTAFPPSLYPLNYEKDRAARIALGADKEGCPVLLWAEGAPKVGARKGVTSCGASLSETEEYCMTAGMVNAVNLDGGGSAQILLHGKRYLELSDRKEDGSEQERPVPLGLTVR